MEFSIGLFLVVISGAVGVVLGIFVWKRVAESKIESAEIQSNRIIENANREGVTIKKEARIQAKDEIFKARSDFEKETRDRRSELQKLEKRLIVKEGNLDKKVDLLEKKEIE